MAPGNAECARHGGAHSLDQLVAVVVHRRLRRAVRLKPERTLPPAAAVGLNTGVKCGRLIAKVGAEAIGPATVARWILPICEEGDPQSHGWVAKQRDHLWQARDAKGGGYQGGKVEREGDSGGIGALVTSALARRRAAATVARPERVEV